MKKFKFIALLLILCLAISMFAGCHISSFTVKNGKISYGVSTVKITECFLHEGMLSSQMGVTKSADECSDVLAYFNGVKLSESSEEEMKENFSAWQAVVGATCKNGLYVGMVIFENGTGWAEIKENDIKTYYKADRNLDYNNVMQLVSKYVYGRK